MWENETVELCRVDERCECERLTRVNENRRTACVKRMRRLRGRRLILSTLTKHVHVLEERSGVRLDWRLAIATVIVIANQDGHAWRSNGRDMGYGHGDLKIDTPNFNTIRQKE